MSPNYHRAESFEACCQRAGMNIKSLSTAHTKRTMLQSTAFTCWALRRQEDGRQSQTRHRPPAASARRSPLHAVPTPPPPPCPVETAGTQSTGVLQISVSHRSQSVTDLSQSQISVSHRSQSVTDLSQSQISVSNRSQSVIQFHNLSTLTKLCMNQSVRSGKDSTLISILSLVEVQSFNNNNIVHL